MSNSRGQTIISAAFMFLLCLAILFIFFKLPIQTSFIFLLACVIFVVAFLNTNFALIILIFAMLFSPQIKAGGGIPGRAIVIRLDDLLLFVIFFGWMAKMALNKEIGFMKKTPLNAPIIIYILVCVFSTFLGVIQGHIVIKHAFFYLLKYSEYFLLYFMVINNIKTREEAKVFVSCLLLTCFLVCAYAWLKIPSGQRLSAPFEVTSEGEPNTFGGYLLLMLGVILGFIVHPGSRKRQLILILLFGFVSIPFILTLSRGAWLGFFPMYLTVVIMSRKYRLHLITALLLLALVLPFIFPKKVYNRFNETFAPEKSYVVLNKRINLAESAAARIESWNLAFINLKESPLFGKGVPAGTVDNQYTRVLNETGLIGFLVFFWLMGKVFSLARRAYKSATSDVFARGLTLGFIAGFIGLLIQSFTAASFIIVRIMEPFWFIAAIVLFMWELNEPETRNSQA
jgi:O-antigen ligase